MCVVFGETGPFSARISRETGETTPKVQVAQLPWSAVSADEGADTGERCLCHAQSASLHHSILYTACV